MFFSLQTELIIQIVLLIIVAAGAVYVWRWDS